MIYYDVTKMQGARGRSGLTRVSSRLLKELGAGVTPVLWDGGFRLAGGGAEAAFRPDDWLLTVELFSEAERPGFRQFVAGRPCRLAGMFYDAIPLRFPHITWPQSVQRHPDYMKLLAGFDRVFAISEEVARDLTGFWQWQEVTPRARVMPVKLGADFDDSPRVTAAVRPEPERPALLCVGIVEPRKNQAFLLGVVEALWHGGLDFDLHIAGRVNPHFGEPILRGLRRLQRSEPRLHYHAAPDDRTLGRLYAAARAVVFPTMAEGNGLPILEALWHGVPCVCSDLPVLRENTEGGGCLTARPGDGTDWAEKLRAVLQDGPTLERLRREAVTRPLPRWSGTAQAILAALD
jgi:glycosyltransferase involved in cell wall biosynthesis